MLDQQREQREQLVERMGAQMRRELDSNKHKGDWRGLSTQEHEFEVMYHVIKLVAALRDDNKAGIREYAADVANHVAMVADACGVLEDPPAESASYEGVAQLRDRASGLLAQLDSVSLTPDL